MFQIAYFMPTIKDFIKNALAYPVSTETKEDAKVEAKQAAGDHFDTFGFHTISGGMQPDEVFNFKKEVITSIAMRLSELDPIGNQVINIPLSAIVSAGINITAEEPKVQSVIDEFWINPQFPHAGFQNIFIKDVTTSLARNLMVAGNLYLPVSVNPIDGYVDIGYINPFRVVKVDLDKGNPLIKTKLHLQPEIGHSTGRKFDIIRVERSQNGFSMDGEVFVFTINRVPNSGIGNSDLMRLEKKHNCILQDYFR